MKQIKNTIAIDQNILKTVFRVLIVVLLVFGSFYTYAQWTSPGSQAPGGNIEPPITALPVNQVKTGGLSVSSMLVEGPNSQGPVEISLGEGNNGKLFINRPAELELDDNIRLFVGGNIRADFGDSDERFLCVGDQPNNPRGEVSKCLNFPGDDHAEFFPD